MLARNRPRRRAGRSRAGWRTWSRRWPARHLTRGLDPMRAAAAAVLLRHAGTANTPIRLPRRCAPAGLRGRLRARLGAQGALRICGVTRCGVYPVLTPGAGWVRGWVYGGFAADASPSSLSGRCNALAIYAKSSTRCGLPRGEYRRASVAVLQPEAGPLRAQAYVPNTGAASPGSAFVAVPGGDFARRTPPGAAWPYLTRVISGALRPARYSSSSGFEASLLSWMSSARPIRAIIWNWVFSTSTCSSSLARSRQTDRG